MVMNLLTSQKYIKWGLFLTFTCNQREHPGLAHLHTWKVSMKWTECIPGYQSISMFDKKEFKKATEQASAPHLYSHWNSVKYMLLRYIKNCCALFGVVCAIFARNEYQEDEGNLCHNHLILAIDRSTLNDVSETFIQDLI